MIFSNMELALHMQLELVASAGRRNVFFCVGNTKRGTGRVFGVEKGAHTFTARNEEIGPLTACAKTSECSGVVAARRGS